MSLSKLSQQTLRRLPTIKAGLLKGDNYTTIGKACGVTERTIDRDIKAWLQSGDFWDWIKTQWIELHGKITTEDPKEAYKQITKLFGKMVTQKQEITAQGTINIDGLEGAVNKIIEFSRTEENGDEG